MPKKFQTRKDRQKAILDEIDALIEKTKEPLGELESDKFSELPISENTLKGLKEANFITMTEIQKQSLPLTLRGRDVLAAAKTGSGKTLAFLIPVIERLYLNKWGSQDGLGALIISPTRELAVQIFRVLCKIGKHHSFSAGLVIGGKDVKVEKERISRMNILIGTPGRLLQHMDETATFDASHLNTLVLDEADRCLDMGFAKTINSILEFLPEERQTLLFSATQTKSVRDLSRLSLVMPHYVGIEDHTKFKIPSSLSQYYMPIELPKKLETLYSFIKTHLKTKGIVFMSSCKQVRFVFETFCKMQPGIPLLQLHGKQKQSKRVEIFERFSSTPEAFLFCTDIAARGLDFPAVEWVIQLDCPEDVATYVHRIGRTARYDATGNSLLFLLPSEEAMLSSLEAKGISPQKILPKRSQIRPITNLLQSYCFKDPEIKYLGQKAFISYMKSVYLQKNKDIFDVHKLPAEEYAASLGLPGAPQIKFQVKGAKKNVRDAPAAESQVKVSSQDNTEDKQDDIPASSTPSSAPKTKIDKLFAKKNRTVLAEHYTKMVDFEASSDDEAFMTLKRVDHTLDDIEGSLPGKSMEEVANMTKRQILNAKQKTIKNSNKNEKLLFDDEGNAHQIYELEDGKAFVDQTDVKAVQKAYVENEKQKLELEDAVDKSIAKGKRKEKRLKQKMMLREMNGLDGEEGDAHVYLASPDEEEDSEEDNEENNEEDNEETDSDNEKLQSQLTKPYSNKRNYDSEIPLDRNKSKRNKVIETEQPMSLEEQEALALKLLGDD